MSRPKFLADNDLNNAIVRGVLRREAAISFKRLRDYGLERSPDNEVLAFASKGGLIVVSHDVNSMIAAANQRRAGADPMSGLLLVHQRGSVARVIESIAFIWSASDAEEWIGVIQHLPL